MYLRLSDLVKEELGIFSFDYLETRFMFPEIHLLETVADFHRGKDKFEMTGLGLNSEYKGAAYLSLPSAKIKMIREVDIDQNIRQLIEQKGELIKKIQTERLSSSEVAAQMTEVMKSFSEKSKNAALYDASGSEIQLYSPENFTSGTRLLKPWLLYHRRNDFVKLAFHGSVKPSSPDKQHYKLEQFLTGLWPTPA